MKKVSISNWGGFLIINVIRGEREKIAIPGKKRWKDAEIARMPLRHEKVPMRYVVRRGGSNDRNKERP